MSPECRIYDGEGEVNWKYLQTLFGKTIGANFVSEETVQQGAGNVASDSSKEF